MKISKKLIFIILFAVVFLFLGFFVKASILDIPKAPADNSTLPEYVSWLVNFGLAIGFFAILYAMISAGVLFALSGINASMKTKAKERLYGATTGLLIFLLMYLILKTIYPDLVLFKFNAVYKNETLKLNEPTTPGLYLYEEEGCGYIVSQDGTKKDYDTSSTNIPDTTPFSTDINSVGIVQDAKNNISRIAIIFQNQNYSGMCQYIHPNISCDAVEMKDFEEDVISPKSALVYVYNANPTGDVTFYRNGNFDENGGFLRIPSSTIGSVFEKKLADLSFTGDNVGSTNIDDCKVPKDQQDCVRWNKDMTCILKKCPTLAGKNIGSIKIENGSDLVVLEADQITDMMSNYCQAYPKDSDINGAGPAQIKYDSINTNSLNFSPQYLLIVPIVRN